MKEAVLWAQLCLQGIEGYFPCVHVRPVNPRARKVRPYFPGYLFGRLDLERLNKDVYRWIPGLAGMVSFGGIPSYVPDNLIAAIKRRVDQINTMHCKQRDTLKAGDVVRVSGGPFQGYEAVLDAHLSGEARVQILLKLLNALQVRLELPVEQIQPKKQ